MDPTTLVDEATANFLKLDPSSIRNKLKRQEIYQKLKAAKEKLRAKLKKKRKLEAEENPDVSTLALK